MGKTWASTEGAVFPEQSSNVISFISTLEAGRGRQEKGCSHSAANIFTTLLRLSSAIRDLCSNLHSTE